MDVKVLGQIRTVSQAIDSDTIGDEDKQVALTAQREQLIAPGASPYGNIIAPGRAFQIGNTAAIAAVVAIPTTAVMLALYNNATDGNPTSRCLVIDWVAALNIVSTAVAAQAGIILNIGQTRATPPTNSALIPKKMNGLGTNNDTAALSIINGTALDAVTGLAANWFPFGGNASKPGVAGTPGYQIFVPVDGRIIVPPGRYFAMHVLANVVGETFQGFIGWHERQVALY